MFKRVNCRQGTDEWFEARLGLLTASEFDQIITKTGKQSSSWEAAVNKCVAERILGGMDEGFQSNAMIRGQSLEHEALEFFNFAHGYNFERVGFFEAIDADGFSLGYGCSADGEDVAKKIGLELKCPLSHTHVGYLLNNRLPDIYKHQVQGCMLVTGYEQWIFGSYHPDMKCFSVVVERDDKYISALKSELDRCCEEIIKRHDWCLDRGVHL